MHYVIQDGFFNESGMNNLVSFLEKVGLPFTIVKVVPFIGEIIPDINPEGKVICFGSYSMRHTAFKKRWYPGVFDLEEISNYMYNWPSWKPHILNNDAVFVSFEDVGREVIANCWDNNFFLRPVKDSKVFAGTIMNINEYKEWRHKVIDLEEDDGSSLRKDTMCIVSSPKVIYQEYRLFVINGKVVTGSQYKIGGYVKYDSVVDEDVIQFANERAAEVCHNLNDTNFIFTKVHPLKSFVMDVARTPNGLKIIELNTMNSAGFYHSDVNKIITSLEELFY